MRAVHHSCWLSLLALGLGCSGPSSPEQTYFNPYEQQPAQQTSPQPAGPSATTARPGPTQRTAAPSSPARRSQPRRPRRLEIVPASAANGPPLPYEDYLVWTRQSAALLDKMAGLYQAMMEDGDVESQSRVDAWSGVCHDMEELYRDVMTTPPPSAEMRAKLAIEVLPELDDGIGRAKAAEEAAAGVIDGEIDVFIDYGKQVRNRFATDHSSAAAAASGRGF